MRRHGSVHFGYFSSVLLAAFSLVACDSQSSLEAKMARPGPEGVGREVQQAPEGTRAVVQEAVLGLSPPLADLEERNNLSGAACSPAGTCLLIGDEKRYARLFRIESNSLIPGDRLILLPALDDAGKKMKESDGEGIAFDDGNFYIIGSHSNSKSAKKQPSRHFLARIPTEAGSGRPVALGTDAKPPEQLQRVDLDYLIDEDPLLKPRLSEAAGEVATADNGFGSDQHGPNIEGIAVKGGTTWIGFRGPVDAQGALLYELPTEKLLSGTRPQAGRHRLKLDRNGAAPGQGIRDLAAVSDGILILAGPEMRASAPMPELWHLGGNGSLRFLGSFDADFRGDSPEAISVLGETPEGYRLLILSDGENGSNPIVFRVHKR